MTTDLHECIEMQNILFALEEKLSEDKLLDSLQSLKIHDAWVAVKSMSEYLRLEKDV